LIINKGFSTEIDNKASPLRLIIRAFNSLGFCKRALDRIIHWTTDNSGNTILLGTEKFDNTQVNKIPLTYFVYMNLKDSWQYNSLTPGNPLDTAILIIQSSWELRNSIIRR
jgi:hypothetical protein